MWPATAALSRRSRSRCTASMHPAPSSFRRTRFWSSPAIAAIAESGALGDADDDDGLAVIDPCELFSNERSDLRSLGHTPEFADARSAQQEHIGQRATDVTEGRVVVDEPR